MNKCSFIHVVKIILVFGGIVFASASNADDKYLSAITSLRGVLSSTPYQRKEGAKVLWDGLGQHQWDAVLLVVPLDFDVVDNRLLVGVKSKKYERLDVFINENFPQKINFKDDDYKIHPLLDPTELLTFNNERKFIIKDLAGLGVFLQKYHSKIYDVEMLREKNGRSSLRISLINGCDIFDRPVTLIVVRRIDRYMKTSFILETFSFQRYQVSSSAVILSDMQWLENVLGAPLVNKIEVVMNSGTHALVQWTPYKIKEDLLGVSRQLHEGAGCKIE